MQWVGRNIATSQNSRFLYCKGICMECESTGFFICLQDQFWPQMHFKYKFEGGSIRVVGVSWSECVRFLFSSPKVNICVRIFFLRQQNIFLSTPFNCFSWTLLLVLHIMHWMPTFCLAALLISRFLCFSSYRISPVTDTWLCDICRKCPFRNWSLP